MSHDAAVLKGIGPDHEVRGATVFMYENRQFSAHADRLTVLEIKMIVGQEPEVALAEIVDRRQVERPNDHVVDLSRGCAFKRVPEFVRG